LNEAPGKFHPIEYILMMRQTAHNIHDKHQAPLFGKDGLGDFIKQIPLFKKGK